MSDGQPEQPKAPLTRRTDKAEALLRRPIEERIAHVNRKVWIPYAEGDHAVQKIQAVVDHPRQKRMPCVLVPAASNNGKSTVLERAREKNPPTFDEKGLELTMPIAEISAPPSAEEDEYFERIIGVFDVPYNPGDRLKQHRYQAMTLLERYKVRAMFIDEFNLIAEGTPSAQRKFLSRIRIMSADLEMAIVGAGTRESINFLNMDPQFASRFEIAPLPKWTSEKRTRSLLASLERDLPFPDDSHLAKKGTLFDRILEESEGTIGDLIEIAKRLACHALREGKPKIIVDMFEKIGWVRRSRRVVEANRALDGKKTI